MELKERGFNMDKPKTLEDIYEAIGGFGRFQLLAFAIILYAEWPAGMMDFLPVFTGGHPTMWICTDESGPHDVTNDSIAMCSCNGTLDGGVETIVSEWKLICGYEWVTDFLTSVQMLGMVTGDILCTYLSDRNGRKMALYLSCTALLVGNLASSVAPNPWVYGMARLVVGTGVSSITILSSVYTMELVTPKWRTLSGAASLWGEGIMTLALLAYLCPSWRMLTALTSIPVIFIYLTRPFLPESPRWLLLNGKVEETKQVLRRMAKWNGVKTVDDELIGNLEDLIKSEKSEGSLVLGDFMRNRKLVMKTFVFMNCWFGVTLVFYGIGFNMKNLSGDRYLNVFYMAVVETIGFRSAIFVSRWLGRKKSFFICNAVTAVLMMLIVLMDTGSIWVEQSEMILAVVTFTGKLLMATAFAIIGCFTSESFPTVARSTGYGLSTFASSVGCILSPQMAYLGSNYKTGPYIVFAACSLICTGSTFFLKETNGKPIDEDV